MIEVKWHADKRDLLHFALILALGFPLVGLVLAWRSGETAFSNWTPFFVCAAIGWSAALVVLILPPVGRLLYMGWMGIGFALGKVVGPVVVSLLYFVVVTPIGLALRLSGRDSLQRRKPEGDSFWLEVEHKTRPRSYRRQF